MFALRNLTLVYYFCFCIFMPLYFIADGVFMKTRVANLLLQALVYSFFPVEFICFFIIARFKCPHCGENALAKKREGVIRFSENRGNYFSFRCVNCGAPLGASSQSGGKK